MTIAPFPVPPIVKTVTVRAAPERAFALFAERFRALVAAVAGAHRSRPGGLCDRAASWRARVARRWARNSVGNGAGI